MHHYIYIDEKLALKVPNQLLVDASDTECHGHSAAKATLEELQSSIDKVREGRPAFFLLSSSFEDGSDSIYKWDLKLIGTDTIKLN